MLSKFYLTQKSPLYDPLVGTEYLEMAAYQGSYKAMYRLGQIYSLGIPRIPQNLKVAKDWLSKAFTSCPGYDVHLKTQIKQTLEKIQADSNR